MNSEKKIEEILSSMEGSSRAKPNETLFSKIEDELTPKTVRMFPLQIAASIAFLILNGWAFQQITASHKPQGFSAEINESSNIELISNFKLYE